MEPRSNCCNNYSESKNGGFTFHENTPIISTAPMNLVGDSQIMMDLSRIATSRTCPRFSVGYPVNLSWSWKMHTFSFIFSQGLLLEYRLSLSYPKDCDRSAGGCDFFLGINTNSENSDYLDFTLEGSAKGWVSVGFSKTSSMVTNVHVHVTVGMIIMHAFLFSAKCRCAGL